MVKRRFAYLVSAFLALSCTFGALAAPADPAIVVARMSGTVEVSHPKKTTGKWQAAKQGQSIGLGWKLRTGDGGKVQLTFPKNNTVILKENSVLYVDKLDGGGGGRILTDKGGLLVQLKNALTPGSKFEVETPAALATVRGTEFAVLLGNGSAEDQASVAGDDNRNDIRSFKSRSGSVIVLDDEDDAERRGESIGAPKKSFAQRTAGGDQDAEHEGPNLETIEIAHEGLKMQPGGGGGGGALGKSDGRKTVMARDIVIDHLRTVSGFGPVYLAGEAGKRKQEEELMNPVDGSALARRGMNSNVRSTALPDRDDKVAPGEPTDDTGLDSSRIKVHFHWDREGKNDDKSSCWLRIVDLDGDGRPDLAIGDADGDGLQDQIALSIGAGVKLPKAPGGTEPLPEGLASITPRNRADLGGAAVGTPLTNIAALSVGDLDGDGTPDALVLGKDRDGCLSKEGCGNGLAEVAASGKHPAKVSIPDVKIMQQLIQDGVHESGKQAEDYSRSGGFNNPQTETNRVFADLSDLLNEGMLGAEPPEGGPTATGLINPEEAARLFTSSAALTLMGLSLDPPGPGDVWLPALSSVIYTPPASGQIRSSDGIPADQKATPLKKEEGGRHTPFHNKYRPQFTRVTAGDVNGDGRGDVIVGDFDGDGVLDHIVLSGGDAGDAAAKKVFHEMAKGIIGNIRARTAGSGGAGGGAIAIKEQGVKIADVDGDGLEDTYYAGTPPATQEDSQRFAGAIAAIVIQARTGEYIGDHELAHGSLNELDEYVEAGLEENSRQRIVVQKHLLEPHESKVALGQLQQQQNMLGGLDMASQSQRGGGTTPLAGSLQSARGDGLVPSGFVPRPMSWNLVQIGDLDEDGLDDYMVQFTSGPRQTTSQDGSFSHGPGSNAKSASLNVTASPGGSVPQSIVIVADLDGDGEMESLTAVPAGDVNGDGEVEFAVSSKLAIKTKGTSAHRSNTSAEPKRFGIGDTAPVFLSKGTQGSQVGGSQNEQGLAIAAGDLDGDGAMDWIVELQPPIGGGDRVRPTGGMIAPITEMRDADADGVIDPLDDDSDNDGLEDFAVGDINDDGVVDHAFLHSDVDGDGAIDWVVLTGFSNGDIPDQERKASHDVALNAIRNMKGIVAGGGGPMAPPMPNIPIPLQERKSTQWEPHKSPGLDSPEIEFTSGDSILEDGSFEQLQAEEFLRRGASTRDSDGLVFNVVNPRAARDNHLQGAVDVMGRTLETDTDKDDVPDYLDPDDDGDGIEDAADDDVDGDGTAEAKELKLWTDKNADGKIGTDELNDLAVGFTLDGSRSLDDGEISVRAFNKLHRLSRGRKSKSYQDQTDSDPAGKMHPKLYQEAVDPFSGANAGGERTKETHKLNLKLYGYESSVEVSNEHGTEILSEGQTIDVADGSAPTPPYPSGPDAALFREELKDQFKNGDIPDQTDFADTIDSLVIDRDQKVTVLFNPREYNIRLQQLVEQSKETEAALKGLKQPRPHTQGHVQVGGAALAAGGDDGEGSDPELEAIASALPEIVKEAQSIVTTQKRDFGDRMKAGLDQAGGKRLGASNGGVEQPGSGDSDPAGILIGLLDEIEAALSVFGSEPKEISAPATPFSGDSGDNQNWDFGGDFLGKWVDLPEPDGVAIKERGTGADKNRAAPGGDDDGDGLDPDELDPLRVAINTKGTGAAKGRYMNSGGIVVVLDGGPEQAAAYFDLWSELLNSLESSRKLVGASKWKNIVLKRGLVELPDLSEYDDQLDALIARAQGLHTMAHEAAHTVQQSQRAQMNAVQSNPLYQDKGVAGENPMYEGNDLRSIDGGGIKTDYVLQNNETDLEFLRVMGEVMDGLLEIEADAASLAGVLKGMSWGGGIKHRTAGGGEDPAGILIGLFGELEGALSDLRAELASARKENADLRATLGTEGQASPSRSSMAGEYLFNFEEKFSSAIEDFEKNTEGVSGGFGLTAPDDGVGAAGDSYEQQADRLAEHFSKWDQLLTLLKQTVDVNKEVWRQDFGPVKPDRHEVRTTNPDAPKLQFPGRLAQDLDSFDGRLDELVNQAHQQESALVEVLIAAGMSGGLALTTAQLSKNSEAQAIIEQLEAIAGKGEALANEEAAAVEAARKDGQFIAADFNYKEKASRVAVPDPAEILIGLLVEIKGVHGKLKGELAQYRELGATSPGTGGGGGSGGQTGNFDFGGALSSAFNVTKRNAITANQNNAGRQAEDSDGADGSTNQWPMLVAHFDKWSELANTLGKAKAWMVNNYEVHPVFGLKTDWTWMGPDVLGPFESQLAEQQTEAQNMRERINALEQKLQNLGMLARSSGGESSVDPANPNVDAEELARAQDDLQRTGSIVQLLTRSLQELAQAELAKVESVDPDGEMGTRAQDHNSSRSNKTASVAAPDGGDDGDGGGNKAQDHNSSRSNKTASVAAPDGGDDGDGGQKAQDHNSSRSNKTGSVIEPDVVDDTRTLLMAFFTGLVEGLTSPETARVKWSSSNPSEGYEVIQHTSNAGLQEHIGGWDVLILSLVESQDTLRALEESYIGARETPEADDRTSDEEVWNQPTFDTSPFEAQLSEIDSQLSEIEQQGTVGAGQVIEIIERMTILNTAAEALVASRDGFIPDFEEYANKYAMYGVMKAMRKQGGSGKFPELGVLQFGTRVNTPQSEPGQAFLEQVKLIVPVAMEKELRAQAEAGNEPNKDYATDPYVETAQRYASDPYSEDLIHLIQHYVSVMDKLSDLDAQLAESRVTVRGWDPAKKKEIVGEASKFERISQEWERYETHDQTTQMKFLWVQVLGQHDIWHDLYEDFGDAVGMKVKEKANRTKCSSNLRTIPSVPFDGPNGEIAPTDVVLPAIQNELLPAVQSELLPAVQDWLEEVIETDALFRSLHERMEEMQDNIDPLISSNEDVLDQLRGLIDPGDPVLGTRFENMDTDNDGLSDVAEISLGLDPLASNDDGFIELISPEDGETFRESEDQSIEFAFEPLETDERVEYNLVLQSSGKEIKRSNVAIREFVTLIALRQAGFSDDDGDGATEVEWFIEGRYIPRSGVPIRFASEHRSFTIEQPVRQSVIIDIDDASTVQRVGGDILIHGSISEVNSLGEWEIRVAYDPRVLQFERGRKLGIFSAATVFFGEQAGGVVVISGSAPRGGGGISGEGEIFELQFTALAADDTVVEGQEATLSDTVGQEIETDFGNEADLSISGGGAAGVGRGQFDEKFR